MKNINPKLLLVIFTVLATILVIAMAMYASQWREADNKAEEQRYEVVQRRISENVCPKCNGQMENGFTVDRGRSGSAVTIWVQGNPKFSQNGVNTEPNSTVVTMRCKACGFLESYAK